MTMAFTIAELKAKAAQKGVEVIVLASGENLPPDMRGKTFKHHWLCIPAETDTKIIYTATARFAKVYTYTENENPEPEDD